MQAASVNAPTLRELVRDFDNDYLKYEKAGSARKFSSSIIIPVYNEEKIFESVLQHLRDHPQINAWPSNFELIVVDDCSPQDLRPIVMANKPSCDVKYMRLDKNSGSGMARNAGIEVADGEIMFFLDSDVFVPQNYFQSHWDVHSSIPALCLNLGEKIKNTDLRMKDGKIMAGEWADIRSDFRWKGVHWKSPHETFYLMRDTQNFRYFNSTYTGPWTLDEMVVSCNMSARASEVKKIGGFHKDFVGWGYEDTYFGAQMIARGNFIVPLAAGTFQTSAVCQIFHEPRREGGWSNRRVEMIANGEKYQALLDVPYYR